MDFFIDLILVLTRSWRLTKLAVVHIPFCSKRGIARKEGREKETGGGKNLAYRIVPETLFWYVLNIMTTASPAIIDSPTQPFSLSCSFYKFYNLLEILSVEKIAAWLQIHYGDWILFNRELFKRSTSMCVSLRAKAHRLKACLCGIIHGCYAKQSLFIVTFIRYKKATVQSEAFSFLSSALP